MEGNEENEGHWDFERVEQFRKSKPKLQSNFVAFHRGSIESGWLRALKPTFATFVTLRSFINRDASTSYCAPHLRHLYRLGFLASSLTTRKMAAMTGWGTGSISRHVVKLERLGVLTRFPVPWPKNGGEQSIFVLGVNVGDIRGCVDCIFFDMWSGMYGNQFAQSPDNVREILNNGQTPLDLLDDEWNSRYRQAIEELSRPVPKMEQVGQK